MTNPCSSTIHRSGGGVHRDSLLLCVKSRPCRKSRRLSPLLTVPPGPLLVLILLALVTCGFVMFYRGSAWTTFLKMMYAPYAEYYLVVAAFVTAMGLLSYIWEVGIRHLVGRHQSHTLNMQLYSPSNNQSSGLFRRKRKATPSTGRMMRPTCCFWESE